MKTTHVHRNNTCEPPVRLTAIRLLLLIACVLVGTASPVRAGHRGDLLHGQDRAVLHPPATVFESEMLRLPPLEVGFRYRPAINSFTRQSIDAELADLRTALRIAGTREPETIVRAHEAQRLAAAAKFDSMRETVAGLDTPETETETERVERKITIVEGLPKEFAEYFRGWIAFKEGRTNDAIKAFEAVLGLPEKERRHKSVWAAYMLGRAQLDAKPDKAIASFQLARALAKQGFGDPVGLAAESVGWEARAHVMQKRFVRAMELYRQQFAAGDRGALVSFRWMAEGVFEEGGQPLADVAAHPIARRIMTAMMTSQGGWLISEEIDSKSPEWVWMDLMEQVGKKDAILAEQLALRAYQLGSMTRAKRWIDRAGKAPVAEWIRAKILLHSGKLDEAGRLLASLAPQFPREHRCTDDPSPTRMAECLERGWTSGDLRIEAELAVVRLSQGRYAEALDLFMRSGSMVDAAYVAERVLSLDELKAYVDRSWPLEFVSAEDLSEPGEDAPCREHNRRAALRRTEERRRTIRSLLARRFVRSSRGAEAQPYFGGEMVEPYERMLAGLKKGEDENLPKDERAKGWWEAAQIMRTNGLELVATEVEPDWATYSGSTDATPTLWNRMASDDLKIFAASKDEMRRAGANGADPDVRYHYRYQAAFIAMDAAKLLPNNDELTAKILYTAGCWLKDREPKVADIFYKALVRRCGKTALGHAADVKRWFPPLDEEGRPILKRRPPPVANESLDGTIPPPVPPPVLLPDETTPP